MKLNQHELATCLTALRWFQRRLADLSADDMKLIYSEHFQEAEPLTAEEIDALCERLNTESA